MNPDFAPERRRFDKRVLIGAAIVGLLATVAILLFVYFSPQPIVTDSNMETWRFDVRVRGEYLPEDFDEQEILALLSQHEMVRIQGEHRIPMSNVLYLSIGVLRNESPRPPMQIWISLDNAPPSPAAPRTGEYVNYHDRGRVWVSESHRTYRIVNSEELLAELLELLDVDEAKVCAN